MNTGKRAVVNVICWLLPGVAAGMILAAVLSWHEYRTVAEIAGSVVKADTADIFAQSLKESAEKDAYAKTEKTGEKFLETYGYRPMRNWGEYLPFAMMITILLFQLAGGIIFCSACRAIVAISFSRRWLKYLRDLS